MNGSLSLYLGARRRRAAAVIAGCGLAALLAGCTVGPNFAPPKAPKVNGYTVAGEPRLTVPHTEEIQQHIAIGKKISGNWWQLFHSRPLDQVVEQAIGGNADLTAAKAHLAQAQEVVNETAGVLYPQIDAAASIVHRRENFAVSVQNTNMPPAPPATFNFYSFGPSLSYVLDAFGLERRSIERAQALAQRQDYELDGAYLTVAGNAVALAIEIAGTRAQIKAMEQIIADDEKNLEAVQTEFRVGRVGQPDVEAAASQLAGDRARLPPLRQQLSVGRHALSVLVGRAPSVWSPPDFDLQSLTLPQELPVSLPSELVHQRPDILAAEAQLHAATAAIGVATAQLYPNIVLSADLAEAELTRGDVFGPSSVIWSFGTGLTAPIFHGGALEAQRRGAKDAFQVTVANYEKTVLQAFGQVADLLQALAHDAELLKEERRAIETAQASLNLQRTAYTVGRVNIVQLLDAERLYAQALLGYTRATAQRYSDTAQLFVAMGGGWWDWRGQDGGGPAATPPQVTPVGGP